MYEKKKAEGFWTVLVSADNGTVCVLVVTQAAASLRVWYSVARGRMCDVLMATHTHTHTHIYCSCRYLFSPVPADTSWGYLRQKWCVNGVLIIVIRAHPACDVECVIKCAVGQRDSSWSSWSFYTLSFSYLSLLDCSFARSPDDQLTVIKPSQHTIGIPHDPTWHIPIGFGFDLVLIFSLTLFKPSRQVGVTGIMWPAFFLRATARWLMRELEGVKIWKWFKF